MINSKSSDFALFKMMQDFKNDLLHHFLDKFNLDYFDFGIISNIDVLLGNQRPLIFDNACECLPIKFLQNQKLNLFLFLGNYYKDINNGIITKTHYVKRDTFLNKVNSGSYEYLEFVIKYHYSSENANNICKNVALIMDNLHNFLSTFQSKNPNHNFRLYTPTPHYIFDNFKNHETNQLSIANYSSKYKDIFNEHYDWLTDDETQSIIVSFYDNNKPGQVDLMYTTILSDVKQRLNKCSELKQLNDNYDEIIDKLNSVSEKYHNFIYFKLNITNLIYYFFNCDNVNLVEPSYLTKKIISKYKKKNIEYKENY